MRVASFGEILWDVIGGAEFLGGAPFNICAHLKRLGDEPFFISAVGRDERGERARARAAELGIDTRFLTETMKSATGVSQVLLDSEGRAKHSIPRPAAYDYPQLTQEQMAELVALRPAWICYGTLTNMQNEPRTLLARSLEAMPDVNRFYDVNLRPGLWTRDLVAELMQGATAVKLNDEEVTAFREMFGFIAANLKQFAENAAHRFDLDLVCITRGPDGCVLWQKGECVESAGFPVEVADTVGAGDAFSAALLHGLAQGGGLADVAEFANRVGALVASRAGAIPDWTEREARELTRI